MLCNRNMQVVMGRQVCEKGLLGSKKICLIDIGAREGIQNFWQQLKGCLKFVGFDPDVKECERINKLFREKGVDFTVFPYAVHDTAGRQTFHITRFPHSSGFLAADPKFNSRLSEINNKNLEVVRDVKLDTITLDAFLKQTDIPAVDFLKVDTEGSELFVLKGAEHLLDSKELLGIESEVWIGPIKESDNLATIHTLLGAHGFYLFDINIGRYPRNIFPRGFLGLDPQNGQTMICRPHPYGQILTGDVVYLRDPVWEFVNGVDRFSWEDATVLKMAMLFELYQLYDCAIELLQVYRDNFMSDLEIVRLIDLLTPPVSGTEQMNYQQYVEKSLELPWRELEIFRSHWRSS